MRWLRSPRPLAVAVFSPVVFLGASCGPKLPPLFPVNGQVSFNGKPTPGALVVFLPVDAKDAQAPRPSGSVRDDGTFSLSTYPGQEGAPEGDYHVVITCTDANAKIDSVTGEVPNKLPARYANPKTSGLQAKVQGGAENKPVFKLTP